jgi:hypothetical protein
MRRAWPRIQTHVLAYEKKIGPVDTQQAGALQTDIEACVEIWQPAVGLQETEQPCHNTEISKQSTQKHR